MKKIRIMIAMMLVFLCISSAVNAQGIATMYAPDGRTASVYSYDVPAWKSVGWYEYPVAAMYAPDGRVEIINRGSMQDWVNVGWFTYPVATVYAPDGRAEIISKDSVQDWINVGWYTYPVATLYAPDGRSIVVDKNTLNDWVSVGWSTTQHTLTPAKMLEKLQGYWHCKGQLGGIDFIGFENDRFMYATVYSEIWIDGYIKNMTVHNNNSVSFNVFCPSYTYADEYIPSKTIEVSLSSTSGFKTDFYNAAQERTYTFFGTDYDTFLKTFQPW